MRIHEIDAARYLRGDMRTRSSLLRFLSLLACVVAVTATAVAQQNWRWVNMLPGSSEFKKVAYGNSVYVAVGDDATIATSPDAATWTVRRMGTSGWNLNGVAFGNGRFVAVGMGGSTAVGAGLLMTSTDGVTWTVNDTVASTINAQFSDVVYGNDLWVVSGASQNRVLTSPDGLTWTARNAGSNTGRIAFGGGRFFALTNNNAGLVSTDGITWTKSTINATTNSFFEGIAYGNSRFVAVGRGSDFGPLTANSADGVTWTPGTAVGGTDGGVSWVGYGNNVFAMGGNSGVFSSPDGAAWTKQAPALPATRKSSPNSVGTENIGSVSSANGTLFVFGIYGTIMTSTDGATWTRRSSGTAHDINGLVYDGTKFVGVGTGGTVVTSPDGITWTAATSNQTGWLGQLAYGNGRYVTAGIAGGFYSSDLKTWTTIPGTAFNQMFGVIYANDRFVAANNAISLGLPTSSDGTTWTTPKITGATGSIQGLAGGGGSFVVTTGGFGATPKIYTSADATTWVDKTPANFTNPESLAYGNGRYVLLTSTHSWTSTDGMTWTSTAFLIPSSLTQVKFVGANFVARGTSGIATVYKSSSDGVTWTTIENSTPPNAVVAAMIAQDTKVLAVGGGGAILMGDLATGSATSTPTSQAVAAGATATLSTAATGTIQWQRNGSAISGATSGSLSVANVQPESAGIYSAAVDGSVTPTQSAVLGVSSAVKVVGTGTELGPDIKHPNGKFYDQILLEGTAATLTADATQVTRVSFIDLDDDIVQVEFSGAGTLTVVLDSPTGPAKPVNYNQDNVSYMKGHAGIVITGADESSNVSVFTVGRATAFDSTGAFNFLEGVSATNDPAKNGSPLFVGHQDTQYDGIADLAFIAIQSTNGKFGGLRTANANYFASKGFTGIFAPGVAFQGPVYLGDLSAFDNAIPVVLLGSASDVRVTGGDMLQANSQAVLVSGITQLKFTAGGDSHGKTLAAQNNAGVFKDNGSDVTATIVNGP